MKIKSYRLNNKPISEKTFYSKFDCGQRFFIMSTIARNEENQREFRFNTGHGPLVITIK